MESIVESLTQQIAQYRKQLAQVNAELSEFSSFATTSTVLHVIASPPGSKTVELEAAEGRNERLQSEGQQLQHSREQWEEEYQQEQQSLRRLYEEARAMKNECELEKNLVNHEKNLLEK